MFVHTNVSIFILWLEHQLLCWTKRFSRNKMNETNRHTVFLLTAIISKIYKKWQNDKLKKEKNKENFVEKLSFDVDVSDSSLIYYCENEQSQTSEFDIMLVARWFGKLFIYYIGELHCINESVSINECLWLIENRLLFLCSLVLY